MWGRHLCFVQTGGVQDTSCQALPILQCPYPKGHSLERAQVRQLTQIYPLCQAWPCLCALGWRQQLPSSHREEEKGLGGLICQVQPHSWHRGCPAGVASLLPGLLFCLKVSHGGRQMSTLDPRLLAHFWVSLPAELESGGLVSFLIHSRGHLSVFQEASSHESPPLHMIILIPDLSMELAPPEEESDGENNGEQ